MNSLPSNKEWIQWGEKDPLHAVAAWPDSQKDGAKAWTDDAFYSLGQSDWTDFRREWQSYGMNQRAVVEIGCGAGRITRWLAEDFQAVHALDVSDGMIRYAREHVRSCNVTFHLVAGTKIPVPDASVTAIFSTHVFQHFDNQRIGREYFTECARVLAPSGSLMIHVPIYEYPMLPRQHEILRAGLKAISHVRATVKRVLGIPLMRGTRYNVTATLGFLRSIGFTEIQVRIFAPRSNQDFHPFLLARRS
jgi:SAM-dependent methyltransferase